jgi:hypothetical protein
MALALVAGCGDDGDDDGGVCSGAGTPPSGCEVAVASSSACPSVDEVCAGVCGAAYDCCFCGDDDWQILFLDCPPCPDAAP